MDRQSNGLLHSRFHPWLRHLYSIILCRSWQCCSLASKSGSCRRSADRYRLELSVLYPTDGNITAVGLAVFWIVDRSVPLIRAGGFETTDDNEPADPLCLLGRIWVVMVQSKRSAPICRALQPSNPATKLATANNNSRLRQAPKIPLITPRGSLAEFPALGST
jgi:hypothetical protein